MNFESKYIDLVKYTQKKYKNLDAILSIYTVQILWVSPKVAKALGYTQKEMEEMSLREAIILDPLTVSSMVTGFFLKRKEPICHDEEEKRRGNKSYRRRGSFSLEKRPLCGRAESPLHTYRKKGDDHTSFKFKIRSSFIL